jgi:hypothetical protein
MGGNECGLGLGHTNNCPTSDQVGYDRSTWSLDVYWKVRFLVAVSCLTLSTHYYHVIKSCCSFQTALNIVILRSK